MIAMAARDTDRRRYGKYGQSFAVISRDNGRVYSPTKENIAAEMRPILSPKLSKPAARADSVTVKLSHDKTVRSKIEMIKERKRRFEDVSRLLYDGIWDAVSATLDRSQPDRLRRMLNAKQELGLATRVPEHDR